MEKLNSSRGGKKELRGQMGDLYLTGRRRKVFFSKRETSYYSYSYKRAIYQKTLFSTCSLQIFRQSSVS